MQYGRKGFAFVLLPIFMGLTGCGVPSFLQKRAVAPSAATNEPFVNGAMIKHEAVPAGARRSTLRDLISGSANPNTSVEVNKYLWKASLEVLDFLPIESIDPFTGVIVTGYGTPPGGGKAYRATILVQDPALDARSLKIAMQGRGGSAVSPDTIRAVEDAILTRARQLRIRDGKL
jgi:hypothetical protein